MDKTETEAQASMVAALNADRLMSLRAHWHKSLNEIPDEQWDALVAGQAGASPFLRHAWLKALCDSGSASPDTGWHPRFLTLVDEQGVIQAACPLFLKDHSWGEYVFDWAWADAYNRQLATPGHSYYPKLLSAVPFSPIPGPRLLVHPHWQGEEHAPTAKALTSRLLHEMQQACEQHEWSSAHILFLPEAQAQVAQEQGWLIRHGVQFHWQNQCQSRAGQPYTSFDDFLSDMQHDKRKKMKQERKKVQQAGVELEVIEGPDISQKQWDFFYRCYAQTYLDRGQPPYLSREFWHQAACDLPESWALVMAYDGPASQSQPIACALLAVDRKEGAVYGRYWGAIAHVSCLHFEACYYRPLQWCIEQGFQRFEGGAQGEHKLSRGLLPVSTYSAHCLVDARFRDAVKRFLQREGAGMAVYLDELDERAPFRASGPSGPSGPSGASGTGA